MQHFFFDCDFVKSLWSEIERRIHCVANKHIHLSAKNVIVGFDSETRVSKDALKTMNRLIIIGKATISKVKYGNHKNIQVVFEQELNWRKINI